MSEEEVVQNETEQGESMGDPVEALRSGWRDAWQVPALLVGVGMLMLGMAYAMATSPAPDITPVLDGADRLIEAGHYEQAIEDLNSKAYPWIAKGDSVTLEQERRYHLARARAIYRMQQKRKLDHDKNRVAVIREYLEFERLGGALGPRDLTALANTYLARDEIDLALQRARAIPMTEKVLADEIRKRVIDHLLNRMNPETDRAMALLADMLTDAQLSAADMVWALERQGKIRLAAGYADETITRLLRSMPRLERAGVEGRSRLHLILARAYMMVGAIVEAEKQVDHALRLSAAGDSHYPEILLARAQLEVNRGEIEQARNTFSEIADRHSSSVAYPWALLGLGETEAALNEIVLSFEAYETLVGAYDRFGIEIDPSRKEVLNSLLARAEDSLGSGMPVDAIRYAQLAESLYRDQDLPADILLMLAVGHKAAAEALLGDTEADIRKLSALDPSTRAEVQRHMMAAATNYRVHAERFVVTNLPKYASSLWEAADLFDRAGDQFEAITAFKTYSDSMPSDPRYAEAKFRLAEALRAMGDYESAAMEYSELIEAQEGTAGADIGPFSDASRVPLAQAYLYDEDTENDAEAERLLISAIDGSLGTAQTQMFRDALLELAGLYDRTDRPQRAIERYTEFLARYPEDIEAGVVNFKLADAHRRLSDEIADSLAAEAMPAAERNARLGKIDQHRRDAMKWYDGAIKVLGARAPRTLGLFESVALRNAYFYLGDCAFDLGEYDEAIRYYDRARDRYDGEPASLVAMVQIVNAYIAKGEMGRARTANERARRFYTSIPDEVWTDPNLPMDRRDWERWLDSSAVILSQK